MKKVKFIYNPFSGEAVITKNLDTIIGKYQAKGYTIVPFRISTEQNLEDAFLDIDSSYHHILGAGGDGTINQIINIMKKKNLDIPLAILPVGTANDFAKYIGMPADIGSACDKILAGKIQEIDLGKANDKYFINVFSFGLFTDVSHKTPTHLKNTIGKLAYYLNGIKELPSFKKLDIKVTSDEFFYEGNALIFFTFNGRTAGNINISYKSEINDGLLDVIIVKGENIRSTLSSLLAFLKLEHLEKPKDIIHFTTSDFTVEYSDSSLESDIDGEVGPTSPIHISCIENGLKMIY
ncbi:YegS/Rv2252/BmrU family lipid kinase [Fusobacterium mortiferum]|uniref:YegS/Rv2252/BmrU family lipid kinase n=1 Tax=Fusobacterium mortiferum TaxID=850 RepID=A0ABS2G2S9_FUSMR|nr:YegS/Rv2252/BmrU family lipid kinase [Fusobacterium mortiferum]MBM6874883.1 YegS/Rv2252/BmrU family lipid kinase [Fusobacterium mortiferum]